MTRFRNGTNGYKVACKPFFRLTQRDLHENAVSLLEKRAYRLNSGLIRFSEARRVLCPCLNLSKHGFDTLLYELEQVRLITVVPFNGVVVTRTKGWLALKETEMEVVS